ncbi:MAG: hypothetical protein JRE23_09300 [Deltaproteobacteria bacterium]|nr:hypothetical protein [Deltaproteobacteria bacterium]
MELYKKTVLLILGTVLLFSQAVIAEMLPAPVRAAEKRAQDIINARNEYVKQVLQAYKIPFKTDERGVITMLIQNNGKKWAPVDKIVINPVTKIEHNVMVTKGHDIFFYLSQEPLPFHLYVPDRVRIKP